MLAVDLAGEGVNIELWLKTESFGRNPRSRNRMPKRKARSKSMHAEAKALAGRGVAGWGGRGQEGGVGGLFFVLALISEMGCWHMALFCRY